MNRGKRVVSYDWKYEKIENPVVDYAVSDLKTAEAFCKNKIKNKIRFISDDSYKTASYVNYMRQCMKTEGWKLKGDPVSVKYVEE